MLSPFSIGISLNLRDLISQLGLVREKGCNPAPRREVRSIAQSEPTPTLPNSRHGTVRRLPTPRHAAEHILGSFPIVAKSDIKQLGDYRTNLLALAESVHVASPV